MVSENISQTEKFRKSTNIKNTAVKKIDLNNFKLTNKQASIRNIYGKESLYPVDYYREISGNLAKKRENRRFYDEYKKRDIIPFYKPKLSTQLVNPDDFNVKDTKLRKVDIIYEKEAVLPEDIRKKLENRNDNFKIVTSYGNQTQTQIFPNDNRWLGMFTQNSAYNRSKTSKQIKKDGKFIDNPIYSFPQLAQADKVVADKDGIGQFNAYIINMYGWNNPYKKNVYFDGLDKPASSVDHFLVQQTIAKSLIDTLSKRNTDAIKDAIFKDVGKVLVYRDESGKTIDLTISGQLVSIADRIHKDMVSTKLAVSIPDKRKPLLFDYELLDFNEKKPTLKFFEYQTDNIRQLDTDQLLRASVKKFNIEPDTAQKILENLYKQGLITYPRVTAKDGDTDNQPIKIADWDKYKKFKGTAIEENTLRLIVEANKSYNKDVKENFIKFGYWELRSGDKSWKTEDTIFSGDPVTYNTDAFDIAISNDRGTTPEDLTNYMVKIKIGTPATRTQQLARLKTAGIINLRNDRYVLDTRGLYLASAGKLQDNIMIGGNKVKLDNILLYHQQEIKKAKTVKELEKIVNGFPIFDRSEFSKLISKKAKEMVQEESDLAYLESF